MVCADPVTFNLAFIFLIIMGYFGMFFGNMWGKSIKTVMLFYTLFEIVAFLIIIYFMNGMV